MLLHRSCMHTGEVIFFVINLCRFFLASRKRKEINFRKERKERFERERERERLRLRLRLRCISELKNTHTDFSMRARNMRCRTIIGMKRLRDSVV